MFASALHDGPIYVIPTYCALLSHITNHPSSPPGLMISSHPSPAAGRFIVPAGPLSSCSSHWNKPEAMHSYTQLCAALQLRSREGRRSSVAHLPALPLIQRQRPARGVTGRSARRRTAAAGGGRRAADGRRAAAKAVMLAEARLIKADGRCRPSHYWPTLHAHQRPRTKFISAAALDDAQWPQMALDDAQRPLMTLGGGFRLMTPGTRSENEGERSV